MMHKQDVLRALRHLPISVQMTERPRGYVWQCLDSSGSAPNLVLAMVASLTSMATHVMRTVLADGVRHAISEQDHVLNRET